MIFLEAKKIADHIEMIHDQLSGGGVCLNIGSSDLDHLELQPYIKTLIYDRILTLGLELMHVDTKMGLGIDVLADLSNSEDRLKLRSLSARLILANNILEHLNSPEEGVAWIADISPKSSIVIISGPQIYPYHPDPIDNRFRPSHLRLKKLFRGDFEILQVESFFGGSVLVANEPKEERRRSYEWLRTRFSKFEFRKSPKTALRALVHAIYPTRCYIVVLRKI